jgi:hypothetical protein
MNPIYSDERDTGGVGGGGGGNGSSGCGVGIFSCVGYIWPALVKTTPAITIKATTIIRFRTHFKPLIYLIIYTLIFITALLKLSLHLLSG